MASLDRLLARAVAHFERWNAMAARKGGHPADIEELEDTLRDLPDDHPVRLRLIIELGFAHMARVARDTTMSPSPRATAHRSDLDCGIVRLEQAARQAGELDQGSAGYAPAQSLSVAYWTRGDRNRNDQELSINTGMLALRQRAATVLLQGGAANGPRLARWHGFVQVLQLVNWCLAEGRVSEAVEALELGRALVLHMATVAADIPALLSAAGQEALAGEWRAQAERATRTPPTHYARRSSGCSTTPALSSTAFPRI